MHVVKFYWFMLNCVEFVQDWCNIMYYINLEYFAPKCAQFNTIWTCLVIVIVLYGKNDQTVLKYILSMNLETFAPKWSEFSVLYDKSEKSLNLRQIAFIFCWIVSNFFKFDVLLYMQSNPLEFDTIRYEFDALHYKCM